MGCASSCSGWAALGGKCVEPRSQKLSVPAANVSAMNQSAPRNTAESPTPLGQVITQVKGWIERCGWVWAEGQVIELRRRAGGIQFLTVRDPRSKSSATITCTSAVLDAAGPLTEGTSVVLLVHPVLYAESSRFSFECSEIRIVGEGRLLAQLEALKRKLQAEGLFAPEHKLRLPFLPHVIGLVTGAGSDAERDVLATIAKRWPGAVVRVRHALVQGPKAAGDVIENLRVLDADPEVDVIIIARGGGSLEDLLPFSDEGLARAIFACRTPVVSAIGHEPDTPISDLVADLRASTPTDAAKRVVPDAAEQAEQIRTALARVRSSIMTKLQHHQADLAALRSRPVLRDPGAGLAAHVEKVDNLRLRLGTAIDRRLEIEVRDVAHQLTRVRSMSPKATLERGYAIVADAQGRSVGSVHDVEPGDQLLIYLADGQLYAEVDYQGEEQ